MHILVQMGVEMIVETKLDYAVIFKALGDSTRLKIIEILSCGELCACDILESFPITQPTLSYHMKILTESGLVTSKKEGSWMRYSNNAEVIAKVSHFWELLTTEQDNCICKNPEAGFQCE